jgi:hypothetical protein
MTSHSHDMGTGALGLDPAAEPVRPPTSTGTSLRPALIVVALAVLILGVFAAIALLTSDHSASVRTNAPPHPVAGSGLFALPAAHALAPILTAGEPPADIVNAVSVPSGAVRISQQNNSASGGQYDAQIGLRSNATQGALLAFFATDMRRQGWQVFDQGAAANDPGATEVLGKLAGSDGWYWEMGVVVSPTSFGNGTSSGGRTDFTLRLFQQSDQF